MIYNDRFDPRIMPRSGAPRVVGIKSEYTETIDGYICRRSRVVYAICGCDYGWLHTAGGDIRTWGSRSGAMAHLKRHILPFDYGARRDYRKIDLFDGRGKYLCSTTWARDCNEALDHCHGAYKARFA